MGENCDDCIFDKTLPGTIHRYWIKIIKSAAVINDDLILMRSKILKCVLCQ